MSVLSFRLKGPLTGRVDASPLLPHRLAEMDVTEIATLPLRLGRGQIAVGDLFDLSGSPGDTVELEGDERLDFVGAGLSGGTIRVAGPVGHRAGTGMSGGSLLVEGSAGLAAGAAMRGGILTIGGDAGNELGGALPGERSGMMGGRILVQGKCGDRVGERMRRGLIAVGGDAGAYAALHMNAGSLLIGGRPGAATGHANPARGSAHSVNTAKPAQTASTSPRPSPTHTLWSAYPVIPKTSAPSTAVAHPSSPTANHRGHCRPINAPALTEISVISVRLNRDPPSQRMPPRNAPAPPPDRRGRRRCSRSRSSSPPPSRPARSSSARSRASCSVPDPLDLEVNGATLRVPAHVGQ